MLAKAADISLRSVQRIHVAHQHAPHRIRTLQTVERHKFADKLRDIVDLYVDPRPTQSSSPSMRGAR